MGKFFENKNKIAPYTNSLPPIDEKPTDTFYIYLLGNTEEVVKKSRSVSLFQLYANEILTGEKNIPNEKVFDNEKAALIAAKKEFSAHAISIIKINLPLEELKLRKVRGEDGKYAEVVNPDLFKYVESIKSISTRQPIAALSEAKVYEKIPPDKKNPKNVEFKSPEAASEPEPLFIKRPPR